IRSITGNTSVSRNELHMSLTICCSSLKSSGIKVSKGELSFINHSAPLRACAFSVDALIENSLVDERMSLVMNFRLAIEDYRIQPVIPLYRYRSDRPELLPALHSTWPPPAAWSLPVTSE